MAKRETPENLGSSTPFAGKLNDLLARIEGRGGEEEAAPSENSENPQETTPQVDTAAPTKRIQETKPRITTRIPNKAPKSVASEKGKPQEVGNGDVVGKIHVEPIRPEPEYAKKGVDRQTWVEGVTRPSISKTFEKNGAKKLSPRSRPMGRELDPINFPERMEGETTIREITQRGDEMGATPLDDKKKKAWTNEVYNWDPYQSEREAETPETPQTPSAPTNNTTKITMETPSTEISAEPVLETPIEPVAEVPADNSTTESTAPTEIVTPEVTPETTVAESVTVPVEGVVNSSAPVETESVVGTTPITEEPYEAAQKIEISESEADPTIGAKEKIDNFYKKIEVPADGIHPENPIPSVAETPKKSRISIPGEKFIPEKPGIIRPKIEYTEELAENLTTPIETGKASVDDIVDVLNDKTVKDDITLRAENNAVIKGMAEDAARAAAAKVPKKPKRVTKAVNGSLGEFSSFDVAGTGKIETRTPKKQVEIGGGDIEKAKKVSKKKAAAPEMTTTPTKEKPKRSAVVSFDKNKSAELKQEMATESVEKKKSVEPLAEAQEKIQELERENRTLRQILSEAKRDLSEMFTGPFQQLKKLLVKENTDLRGETLREPATPPPLPNRERVQPPPFPPSFAKVIPTEGGPKIEKASLPPKAAEPYLMYLHDKRIGKGMSKMDLATNAQAFAEWARAQAITAVQKRVNLEQHMLHMRLPVHRRGKLGFGDKYNSSAPGTEIYAYAREIKELDRTAHDYLKAYERARKDAQLIEIPITTQERNRKLGEFRNYVKTGKWY